MTCIVGLIDPSDDRVYIGGDSAASSGSNIRVRSDEKVFIKNDMIFGFTSSFRMGQLIRYSLKIPQQERKGAFEYLCTDFIDALKKCLEDNGYNEGGRFLLGYRGQLYHIQNDFQVAINSYGFDACGCGEEYALGSLNVLMNVNNLDGANKIQRSLNTASKFSAYVCSPYTIKCI